MADETGFMQLGEGGRFVYTGETDGPDAVFIWTGRKRDHAEAIRRGWRDCSWRGVRGPARLFRQLQTATPVFLLRHSPATFEYLAYRLGFNLDDSQQRAQAALAVGTGWLQLRLRRLEEGKYDHAVNVTRTPEPPDPGEPNPVV